jgi:primosomal protein N' (replication factor Y)
MRQAAAMSPERSGRVVSVLPDVLALGKTFDYTVPAALDGQVRVGTQVRVVLNGRRVGGWVVADGREPPPGIEVRPLATVRGWGPPPPVVELARWAARRWAGPVAALLRTASPPVAVRALPRAGYLAGADAGRVAPVPEQAATEALAGGTAVVRLAPASDPASMWEAAARLLGRGGPDAGVLVLAPEVDQAGEVARRLREVGHPVALLPGDWPVARAGGVVAVGARAAAFAPLPRLAAAVVLDAHEQAYHEERTPTWHAWGVVAERARRDGAPCALVSPCPTLELLAAGRLVTTPRLAERRGWPPVEIVDRRADDPRQGLFSERLVRQVRWATERPGRQVVCVVNRTGGVRLLACASCNELARCERCGAAVELVDATPGDDPRPVPVLRCRRCDTERPVVCDRCGATRMKARRVGVARVQKELAALTGVAVTAVSGPRRRAGVEPPDGDMTAAVVVGTEAALHRVPAADAVAFLDFDAELLAPRFGAGEQALALLARAGRVVSRSSRGADHRDRAPGRVLVQTRLPRHEVLVSAVSADPSVLARAEEPVRQALGLPPFGAVALVSGDAADAYGAALRAAAPAGMAVRGPVDGVWSVRAPDHDALSDLFGSVARPPRRVRVEVDPVRA